jgi:TetR/AcrR family acrAB operon transcriptional repressor
MCTETGAGAAGAAASRPQPTSSPATISATKHCAAHEDNRRKSGFVSFSNGGIVGKEEKQLRTGGSAQERDYYTIVSVCKPTAAEQTVRRTKQESQQTRQQILDAAQREFARCGVTRTTLQRIAAAAGVTRGAVYWHFANKRTLFRAMRDQVSLPLFDRTELLGTDGPDPLLAVQRFLHSVVDQIENDPQTRRTFEIMSLKCEYVDEFRTELKRHARSCRELHSKLALVYARARDNGAMRSDLSPESAALDTCVFVTGLLRLWLIDEGGGLLRPHVDELISNHIASRQAAAGKRTPRETLYERHAASAPHGRSADALLIESSIGLRRRHRGNAG